MWKPWVIAVVGSIMLVNASAKASHSSATAVSALKQEYEVAYDQSDFYEDNNNNDNWDEVEAYDNSQVQQQVSSIVISKKGIFKGTGNERADLINSLRSAIGQLATPLPGNFNGLCNNVNANVAQDIKETTADGVDGVLAAWNLPQQVNTFLANIKFSEDVTYQTYRFAIQNGQSELQEFIASGRNSGSKIVMAFMKVHVTGQPIQQWVNTQSCKRILFIKRCHTNRNPRGFTTDEIMSIQNGLLHHGYNRLTQEVNGMSLFVEALPHIQAQAITHVTATETEKLNWLERAVIESYKNLKAQFEGEAKREVVKRISSLGFENFVEDAEIKFIKNLQG
jgi:hypothetical protein